MAVFAGTMIFILMLLVAIAIYGTMFKDLNKSKKERRRQNKRSGKKLLKPN